MTADDIAETCRKRALDLNREATRLIDLSLILEGRHGVTILSDPKYAASRRREPRLEPQTCFHSRTVRWRLDHRHHEEWYHEDDGTVCDQPPVIP